MKNINKHDTKFRFWDKRTKKFLFADLREIIDTDWVEAISKTRNFEFQQFTCLLDKNGKEIYEGDIVKITINPINSRNEEIKFDIFLNWQDDMNSPVSYYCQFSEIIGNIFENLNLLKTGK